MALADSTGARRVDLANIVTGVDRANLDLILAAFAHAGGSHEHTSLEFADGNGSARFVRLPSLHSWPDEASRANSARMLPTGGRSTAAEPHR